ncbi:MAG: SGNH/GDSL hydrolase family protein [Acidobacteriota bacterium]|nr:SGNH/GDSL hydrolase family protein [Acidobacteriota bacterium]
MTAVHRTLRLAARISLALLLLVIFCGVALAQEKPAEPCKPEPPKSSWEVEHERLLHEDWPELGRFRAANAALPAPAASERRVVFMGDSITEGWRYTIDPNGPEFGAFFKGKPYLNRGISGQTTGQMLLRFHDDVIALNPAAVVILAGTNDLAGNTGEIPLEDIESNIATMCELAHLHGIRVLLVSVLPAGDYPWRPGREPAAKIVALNGWLLGYAHSNGYAFADVHTSMAAPDLSLKKEFSEDGVHPNSQGYALMEKLLQTAIDQVLARK